MKKVSVGLVPPWLLVLAAMISFQLSAALSVGLMETVGPAGAAWLRLTMGGIVLLAVVRPRLNAVPVNDVPTVLCLGIATGAMSIAFLAAVERIPLGVAIAISFLGPLLVAALSSSSIRGLVWPIMALLGVGLLTEPWHSRVDSVGLGFAGLAGVGWFAYIFLTRRVGDSIPGITALAFTIPVAALTSSVIGVPQALGHITPGVLAAAIGLAFLMPVLPFALEMLALRRMTPAAFGTLTSLEPAVGLVIGLVVLAQLPSRTQFVGVVLVVIAAAAAQRGSNARPAVPTIPPHPC